MKKILLLALVVLSVNGMAQLTPRKPFAGSDIQLSHKSVTAPRLDLQQMKPASKLKTTTVPEGTQKAYFMDNYSYAYGIGYCLRNHFASDIIMTEDSAYISNMFYVDDLGEGVYIAGALNETKDSIFISNQLLTTVTISNVEIELYVCKLDTATNEPLYDTPFALAIDSETGQIYSDDDSFLGFFSKNITAGTALEWFSHCTSLYYTPAEYFPEAETYKYTYADYYGAEHETTVDMIDLGQYVLLKGLLPGTYPDAWMYGVFSGDDIVLFSLQLATDDVAFMFTDNEYYTEEYCIFTYDNTTGTYTADSSMMLANFFYDTGGYGFSDLCSNMVLSPLQSALSEVEAGNKTVASTEYYDLSGRRITLNDNAKGVCIKVQKYTDGTSNATKIMR